MFNRQRIAVALNSIVAGVCALLGLVYLAAKEITFYHKAVIGVEWATLPAGVQTLLIVLMKGTGDAVLVTGVSIAILTWIPLRQGHNWSRWAILTVGLTCLLPMLAGALYLAITTGAPSPWWLNAVLVASLLASFILSRGAMTARR